MMDETSRSSAWSTLLPSGTVWLPQRRWDARQQLRSAMADLPRGSRVAIPASPWAFGRAQGAGEPDTVSSYVAVPSRQDPMLITSRDPAVLRYIADSVLTVPPGVGPLPSMLLTAGLRLLRFPAAWILAALMRMGGVVLVGRPG
jgi:hypothetical protein